MKKINPDKIYLIALEIIVLTVLFFALGHYGDVILDVGREVCYPAQILQGEILYKDLFNIYGPFSYMLNALLYKIFGINLNVLYAAGCICAFSIVTTIYLIAKRFLSGVLSFIIGFFTIVIGLLSFNLFNFVFPYSYAMLYGLTAFLLSVLFLLKYQQDQKPYQIYLSAFFAGISFINKYEFLPYLPVFLYGAIRLRAKPLTYAILAGMPVICFWILFAQGLTVGDLKHSLEMIAALTRTETLKYFYMQSGIYFAPKTLLLLAKLFIQAAVPLALMTYNKKYLTIPAIASLFLTTDMPVLGFLPILAGVFAIMNFKELKKDLALQILVLSAIALSLKVFWTLVLGSYGIYSASLLLIAVFAMIKPKYRKALGIYIVVISLILGFKGYKVKDAVIRTSRGKIAAAQYYAKSTNELINYIEKNTKKTDRIVIFPEGLLINFLTDRPSDNFYNSLIPLYVESIGEKNIINHFKKTQPEYIIFNNNDNSNYYFKTICNDYAVGFCNYVGENYKQEKVIDFGFRYLIFKKK